jgi:ABC-type nitrate/sulfonate/bicarbonate transport system substrate-binding protein
MNNNNIDMGGTSMNNPHGIKTWKWIMTSMAIIVLISVGIFAIGCSRSESPLTDAQHGTNPVVLRVGYRPKALADITPVIIREANIGNPKVQLIFVPLSSPDDGFTKFKAGEIDVMAGMPMEKVFQQLSGEQVTRPFQAYALQVDQEGNGWVSLVGSKKLGVYSIKDIAGKTAASLATDQAEYLLRKILIAAGLSTNDFKTTRYNPTTPLTGLRNGEHAAIFGLEPAISTALAEGNILLAKAPASHFIFGDRPVPLSASLIDSSFIKQQPEAAQIFFALVDKANSITADQPDQVRGYFQKAEYGGLTPEIAKRLFLPSMQKPSPSLKVVTEDFVGQLLHDGILKAPVNLAPLFP